MTAFSRQHMMRGYIQVSISVLVLWKVFTSTSFSLVLAREDITSDFIADFITARQELLKLLRHYSFFLLQDDAKVALLYFAGWRDYMMIPHRPNIISRELSHAMLREYAYLRHERHYFTIYAIYFIMSLHSRNTSWKCAWLRERRAWHFRRFYDWHALAALRWQMPANRAGFAAMKMTGRHWWLLMLYATQHAPAEFLPWYFFGALWHAAACGYYYWWRGRRKCDYSPRLRPHFQIRVTPCAMLKMLRWFRWHASRVPGKARLKTCWFSLITGGFL